MRVVVGAMVTVLALAASSGTVSSGATSVRSHAQLSAKYEPNSTQAVCALTGSHGAYTELPPSYTTTRYGLLSGDSGSSFEFDGRVWWLFGNTGATTVHPPWGSRNVSSRWPAVTAPLDSPAALGSDSIATSAESTQPPAPVAPYNDSEMPPNQACPTLHFLTETKPVRGAFANPSVSRDPLFTRPYPVSLRRGELPEAGISEGHPARMYVVFGTDNPANCATLHDVRGPCAEPSNGRTATTCGGKQKGSRTRSVMAVYEGSARFRGLYDLSAPATRYGPTCPTAATNDSARFVNVQLQNGSDGYLYIWGTEGGANNGQSPVYLARLPAANIASGRGLRFWHRAGRRAGFVAGSQKLATPLFRDRPQPCMAQLGIQYNRFLDEWIMLYHCKQTRAPAGHPNGIYLRTAKHPWGPWSPPTTIFNPEPDPRTQSGYCYFIYSTQKSGFPKCPAGSPDRSLVHSKKAHVGDYYGPYFVANWTTGQHETSAHRASTTIYYTLDTFDPYGQLILRSTILGA